MRGAPIPGHCYETHADVSWTRAEWQDRMRRVIQAGGRRRVENGETFIHIHGGKLNSEIYANVPA